MRQRSAFTLVELLVVIGIIAVLIAILMPALSRANRHAKMAVCLSGQRQLVMALMMYCQENDGRFPGGPGFAQYNGGTGPAFFNRLADWDHSAFNPYSCNSDEKYGPTFLSKYVGGNQQIPACPGFESELKRDGSFAPDNFWTGYWYPMSLVYTPEQIWNPVTIGPSTPQTPQRLSSVKFPSQKAVIIDRRTYHEKTIVDTDKLPTGQGPPTESGTGRSKMRVVVGFADGHAAARPVYEMLDSDVNWTGRFQPHRQAGVLWKDFE